MPRSNSPALAPVIRKLTQRSQLGSAESEALLGLPCRLASIDPGSYLVREGDRSDSCAALLSGFAYRNKICGSGGRQILAVHLFRLRVAGRG